ncbi:YebC/PmpR family DNA-binding transcriptional regulator [Candidatus Gottesmanbacteria bacterium]|nr:YebC/PmpR family DNA-binding transcriptional regulator [Candidatus Gottesmanbacteria bacterium]
MSGHSKWSKVKHQKATTDAVKSQSFTKASRGLTVAVREGGGITDPEKNFHLRLAIEFARSVNMPKDTIERAIEKGAGVGAAAYETLVYEGYGPGGVAYLVVAATDNHQRTGSEVKHQFDRAGGTLATPGAVTYQFRKNGVILVPKTGRSFDDMVDMVIRLGGDDVIEQDDVYEIYTAATELSRVKSQLEDEGVVIELTELIMRASTPVAPTDEIRAKNDALVAVLESLDDVQKVYTTME